VRLTVLDRPKAILSCAQFGHKELGAPRAGPERFDLLSAFREFNRTYPHDPLYFHPENHLNVNGHGLTSELARGIWRRLHGFDAQGAMRLPHGSRRAPVPSPLPGPSKFPRSSIAAIP